MKRKVWKLAGSVTLLVTISLVSILSQFKGVRANTLPKTATLAPEVEEHILKATVQITMLGYELLESAGEAVTDGSCQTTVVKSILTTSEGIGTLLSHQGEVLLISHDHWPHLTSGVIPDRVQFHDAMGVFILEMDGVDLNHLLLFHDGGTLIMRAPPALVTHTRIAADIGHIEMVQLGDVVHVVHREPNQRNKLRLLAAEVEAIQFRNGVPMLTLRSLTGQSIEPGDSGGGMWVNGYLVGNLWKTLRVVTLDASGNSLGVETPTARSYAAGLTGELVELVHIVLEPKAPPSLQEANPS